MDQKVLVEDLRRIHAFQDLSQPDLEWLTSQMTLREAQPGDIIVRSGDPAEYMAIILEGETRAQSDDPASDGRLYIGRAGDVTGMLPYSRLTTFPLTSRAVVRSRFALLHKNHFPEMLERMPVLGQRLVAIMSDRIREVAKMDVQREKLMALGKLSAGLAHELNNPAAAARRAAANLREAVTALRHANIRLDEHDLSTEQRSLLACVERELAEKREPTVLDALEQSDREEQMAEWLGAHQIQRTWELAADLVESGFDVHCLEEVAAGIPVDILEDALTRLMAAVTISRLAGEIENSTGRISELVQSIKEYSHMDQAPEMEVDVHKGIESTLTMLKHELKHGIAIQRSYDPALPKVCARGGELNQVWTNLIDNAVDAMGGKGCLRIRTARELNAVLVEIGDSGPGIPPEIRDRIFEPFFTTKGEGQGTGLGLDMVYRIVRQHRGDVHVESSPGDTRFQVRLPAAVAPM